MNLTPDYITCHMIGRIGNQMFQIAHAYSQALTHNRQFVAPLNDTSVHEYRTNIFRDINFALDKTDNLENVVRIETPFSYSPTLPVNDKPTIFHGFCQSEKFFKENIAAIKKLFSPTPEFVQRCIANYPELASNNITAINVRRGDYLTQPDNHPVVTKEFIHKALEHIPNKEHVYVVSDDVPWCRENINLPNITFVGYTTWEALWLLTLCKHFVISNSTFSWWGAYLGEKPDSIIVAPENWFGPGVHSRGHYETDIYQQNWIKVPTYWDNGEIKLKT
jgi:hypothetical protein